jgi:hypothetical protein
MGSATAIGDASETLRVLLESNVESDGLTVELTSPDTVAGTTTPTLSLFLYRVSESEHLSSVARREHDTETLEQEPIVIDLEYLLTAYPSGSGDGTKQARKQQNILGKAMQVLREHAVVRGSALKGSLDEELRISRSGTDGEIVDMWNTFPETAYLPSVSYTVGPVSIESTATVPADRVESITFGADDG